MTAKNADGHGQVERRAFLLHIGRREIDRDVLIGKGETVVANCGDDSIARFADCSIRQSDNVETLRWFRSIMLTSTSTRYASMP